MSKDLKSKLKSVADLFKHLLSASNGTRPIIATMVILVTYSRLYRLLDAPPCRFLRDMKLRKSNTPEKKRKKERYKKIKNYAKR